MYTRRRNVPAGLFGIRKLGWLAVASMLALAMIGPGTAVALGSDQTWAGNGWPVKENCKDAAPGTIVWIWTGDNPTALTINGQVQAGTWVQSGGGSSSWKFVSTWFDTEPDHATTFVTFTGDDGTLTITHGCPPAPTPTPTPTAKRPKIPVLRK